MTDCATISEYLVTILPKELPLVIGDIPASAVNAIGLTAFNGHSSYEYFGAQQSSTIFNPIVKFVTRSTTYSQGSTWITLLKDVLHKYHDDTILSSLLIGAPMYLGKSPENLHEFQVTFNFSLEE